MMYALTFRNPCQRKVGADDVLDKLLCTAASDFQKDKDLAKFSVKVVQAHAFLKEEYKRQIADIEKRIGKGEKNLQWKLRQYQQGLDYASRVTVRVQKNKGQFQALLIVGKDIDGSSFLPNLNFEIFVSQYSVSGSVNLRIGDFGSYERNFKDFADMLNQFSIRDKGMMQMVKGTLAGYGEVAMQLLINRN